MRKISIAIIAICFATSCADEKNQDTAADRKATIEIPNQDPVQKSIAAGKTVYGNFCVTCHLPDGQGVARIYPPLKNSNWLTEKRTESILALKNGLKGEIEVNGEKYDNIMLNQYLSHEEIRDVLNYVLIEWNDPDGEPFTLEEIKETE